LDGGDEAGEVSQRSLTERNSDLADEELLNVKTARVRLAFKNIHERAPYVLE
jgi:hypothetical protein